MDPRKYKNWSVFEVKVTNYLERYGIEIKIDSMQNDGTQSWIVISRGITKYVTQLPEENNKPIHFEEVASSAGKLVAITQKEQFIPSSSSSLSTVMPINQRQSNYISATGKIDDRSNKISELVTRLLRHQGYLREDDGREHPDAQKWAKQMRIDYLQERKQQEHVSVLRGIQRLPSVHAC